MESRLPGRKGRLMLAYLVVNWDRTVTRDELSFALWGDDLPPDAESGLNAVVSKVRRLLGPEHLSGRSELRFIADDDMLVDVHRAIEALHRAESEAAAGRWCEAWEPAHAAYQIARREFLLGHDAPWVDEWRRRMDDVATRGLECHARCYLMKENADPFNAERAGRMLVERAPFRESGYAMLMEAVAQGGNPAEALRVYDVLSRLLRDELGVFPGPDVSRLRDHLLGVPSGS